MTKEERHELILDRLMKQGSVLVTELAASLDVSLVTIRKDLTELEKAGQLYRSHGKAIMLNPFTSNRSINEKEKLFPEEKHSIGREGAKLIGENDSIVIASGTTVQALARNIQPIGRLMVVSASLVVSEILSAKDNVDIIQLGGQLRHSSLSVVGKYSEMMLDACTFSKLYLGVDGIDLEYGITTTDMSEALLNQKMMASAQKTIVVADSSKFGKRGFAKISNMDEIDIIITDSNVKPSVVRKIEELGIDLILAPASPQAAPPCPPERGMNDNASDASPLRGSRKGLSRGDRGGLLSLLFLIALLFSCTTDSYDKGTGAYSLMQAELVEAYAQEAKMLTHVVTDEGEGLTLSEPYQAAWATTVDSAYRALLYYKKVEDGRAQVVSCSQVPTAVILPLDSFKQGVRQDPVRFESAWVSSTGRYLNVTVYLMTGTPEKEDARQMLAVADDSIYEDADGTHTQRLRLYHDQGGVPEYYSQRVVLSIPLHNVSADSIAFSVNTYSGVVTKKVKKRNS